MADPARPRNGKKTLASVIGGGAAALLLVAIPMHESGRTVDVTVAKDGTATVRHVSGKQYLRAYLDIVGVPTACDGITKGVKMGQTYTESQCAELLERELIVHAEGVMRCTPGLHGAGRDNQRFAAVSLAYNVGVKGWCGSTAARLFNAGQFRAGCDAMLRWNKAGGRIVNGLVRRRSEEHKVCVRGIQA